MAEDIKRVLDIEFRGEQSIADLKREISALKTELDGCKAGSAEAAKKSAELEQKQLSLKAAMKGCVDENGKLNNSYNGLSSQMAKLKAAQKDVDLSTRKGRKEYANYAKEINKINDKLKAADAQNGVWSRNVGNYANSIKDAFGSMGGVMGGLVNGIKGVGNALKLLFTNPWAALIGAIAFALAELAKAFKRNSEASKELKNAGAGLKAVWVAVQRIFDRAVESILSMKDKIKETVDTIKKSALVQFLTDAIGKMFDLIAEASKKLEGTWLGKKLGMEEGWTDNMLAGWKKFTDQFKADQEEAAKTIREITELEDKLAKKRIANTTAIANNNAKIDALNAKISDREQYNEEQRLAFLDEKNKLEMANANMAVAEARMELEIIKKKNSLTQSSLEDKQAEADAQAKLTQATAEAARIETSYNNERRRIQKEGKRDANQELKDANELYKAEKQAVENSKKLLEEKLKHARDYSQEKYDIQYDIIDKEQELDELAAKNSIKNEEELQKALTDIAEKYAIKRADLASNISNEGRDKANKQYDNRATKVGLDKGTSSLDYYQAELDAAKNFYDTMEQMQTESDEDYEERHLAALKNVKDKEKALLEKRISNYTELSAGITELMSTVADSWSENIQSQVEAGKISEEEGKKQFENVKIMQIAIATVQMLTGVATALSGAFTTKSGPWDIALAAVQAASIAASGIANIAKIKNTTLGSSSSSAGSASFALPSLEGYSPNYTQNLTGANDTANLQNSVRSAIENADIKAYVVESEITTAQKRSSKRNAEATW